MTDSAPFTDPRVLCDSCRNRAAVVAVWAREPEHLGQAAPVLLLRCDLLACRQDVPPDVVDTEALTRTLAERLTGLDLATVASS